MEFTQHNHLMDWFLSESLADVLIVPQDDNRIEGSTLIEDVERVWKQYGDKLGVIGGRDGYGIGYSKMASSPFSASVHCSHRLAIGEWAERLMVNTGPLIYNRNQIRLTGFYDPDQEVYGMDDYCLAARAAGLTNVVLGMDIKHEKFGNVPRSRVDGVLAANMLSKLNEKWRPKLGHDVF